jgi:hypothetical protein
MQAEQRPVSVPYSWLPKPVCPKHGMAMRVGSTRAEARYLYCPVPGCRESRCQHRHRA